MGKESIGIWLAVFSFSQATKPYRLRAINNNDNFFIFFILIYDKIALRLITETGETNAASKYFLFKNIYPDEGRTEGGVKKLEIKHNPTFYA